jgi:murein DD-endopeptidase MepM/ murein hydrolase activator NlpD
LIDRVSVHSGRAKVARKKRAAVHIEEFEAKDSFEAQTPGQQRWLLTTCIAGIAGSLIVGSALLGIFGQSAASTDAYASVQPSDLKSSGTLKSDMGGDVLSQVTLAPMKSVSVAYRPDEDTAPQIVPKRSLYGDNLYPEISATSLPYGDGKTVVIDGEFDVTNIDSQNITTITKTPPPEPVDEAIVLGPSRSLTDEITDRGVALGGGQALNKTLNSIFPAAQMKPGTRFELTLDKQQDFYGRDVIFPVQLTFKPGPQETIIVEADEDGTFMARVDGEKEGTLSRYAQVDHFRTKARVGSSLYGTAKDNRVPGYIISELTRVFAYDVDFQRQVKASDSFEIFYGNPLTGSSTKRKVLHYAQLTLGGKTKTLFRYTTKDGVTDYYDENGVSATKSLLRTPVSGARLTSGFGMRRHPLLGYSKMHTGVDFGVPAGTPIKAAGSGVIESAGRQGAYGIAVKIKHSGKYETLYAHMSRLATGIRAGGKVNQGQTIGYVGSTGRSTGPHLHYEVRANDRPVNPTRVKLAGARKLSGKELANFKSLKTRVLAMMQTAPSATQVAEVQQ